MSKSDIGMLLWILLSFLVGAFGKVIIKLFT